MYIYLVSELVFEGKLMSEKKERKQEKKDGWVWFGLKQDQAE